MIKPEFISSTMNQSQRPTTVCFVSTCHILRQPYSQTRPALSSKFHNQVLFPHRYNTRRVRRCTPTCTTQPTDQENSTATVSPPNQEVSSFSRGNRFPRRAIGLYELTKEGVDPSSLVSENSREEGIFSLAVGIFVLSLVVFPVITPGASVEGPLSILAGLLLTVWAVDALALQGRLGRVISTGLQDTTRVARHEAGHMLVGYLLGFPVKGYVLPSGKGLLKGVEVGVEFSTSRYAGDAHCIAAVGMAGIAGEVVVYGTSEGGAEDFADVGRAVKSCYGERKVPEDTMKNIVRWGLLVAVRLLKEHEQAHRLLTEAMIRGDSVEECLQIVEDSVDREKLVKVE